MSNMILRFDTNSLKSNIIAVQVSKSFFNVILMFYEGISVNILQKTGLNR